MLSPPIVTIYDAIQRTRSTRRGTYFPDVGDFLSVPKLSSASPWLHVTGDQVKWGITDEAYEILPSQLLRLVRGDPVGAVIGTDNGLQLRFTSFDGYPHRIEATSDLIHWTTVSEPPYSTNGVFTLPLPLPAEPRFFRAVLSP